MFLHSGSKYQPYRLWRPTTVQFDTWIDLLLNGLKAGTKPLPLVATDKNNYRIHKWDAIAVYRIFRDPWERRIPAVKPEFKDVVDPETYFRGDPGDDHPPEVCEFTEAPPWIFERGGHKGRPLGVKVIGPLGPPGRKSRREMLEFEAQLSAPGPST